MILVVYLSSCIHQVLNITKSENESGVRIIKYQVYVCCNNESVSSFS